MSHNPPFSRRELKKKGLLDEDKFYRDLAQNCGYIDDATARRFYLGLVKTVTADLRADQIARLPHLGDFALVWQKEKSALVGKTRVVIGQVQMLKFYPKDTWREYFAALRKDTNGT